MLSIRKLTAINRTYRHFRRYRQILSIFIRYGFDDIFKNSKIEQYLEDGLSLISRKSSQKVERLTRPERVRMALEELGPTFIKLGQVLSIRPDLIHVDYITEFSKLQDDVPPCNFDQIKPVLETELNGSLESKFKLFEEKPIASASIGQVHRATLLSGEQVAVKVKRPGIEQIIEVDLEILLYLANLLQNHIKEFALHHPAKVVEEFAKTLSREIDFLIEASNINRFQRFFENEKTVYIPKVYEAYTTESILVMEFIEGIKISNTKALKAAGHDLKTITKRGTHIILKQVFELGFFHADPHPGNIFVMSNQIICLLDFGMVGSVDRFTREDFIFLLESLVQKKSNQAAQILLNLTVWTDKPDMAALEEELDLFMELHLNKPIKEVDVEKVLQQFLKLTSVFYMRIPPNIFLMIKAFATVEGIARMLDPDFDIIAELTPYVTRIKLSKLDPRRIIGDLVEVSNNLLRFIHRFPQDMLELGHLIQENRFVVNTVRKDLEQQMNHNELMTNRLTYAIIMAALFIGSCLLLTFHNPPFVFGISMYAVFGFIGVFFVSVWLFFNYLKSRF